MHFRIPQCLKACPICSVASIACAISRDTLSELCWLTLFQTGCPQGHISCREEGRTRCIYIAIFMGRHNDTFVSTQNEDSGPGSMIRGKHCTSLQKKQPRKKPINPAAQPSCPTRPSPTYSTQPLNIPVQSDPNHEQIYTPGNKRVSGYRFRYQLTCPLCTGVFLGNAWHPFLGPLTQKQLTCLSSCNWGLWISTLIWDMFAIFGG